MNALEHLRGVLATQHLHYSLHSVVVLAFIVAESQHALALKIAVFQLSQLFQVYGRTTYGFHHDIAQPLEVVYQADASYHIAQTALREDTSSGVEIVLLYLFSDVRQRYAVFHQPLGRKLYLVMPP